MYGRKLPLVVAFRLSAKENLSVSGIQVFILFKRVCNYSISSHSSNYVMKTGKRIFVIQGLPQPLKV